MSYSTSDEYHVFSVSPEAEYDDKLLISTENRLSGAKCLLEKESVAVVLNSQQADREIIYSNRLSEDEKQHANESLEDYLIENNLSPFYEEISGRLEDEIDDIWTSMHGQTPYPFKQKDGTLS